MENNTTQQTQTIEDRLSVLEKSAAQNELAYANVLSQLQAIEQTLKQRLTPLRNCDK